MDFNYCGFKGVISDKKYASAKNLEKIPEVKLIDSAERALRYLEANPLPDRDYQNLFSFAPFCCPPLQPIIPESEGYVDPIFIGDTESRNDMAFNMMLSMLGKAGGSDAQERVHERLLSYIRKDGIYKDICWHRGYNASICEKRDYASFWSTGMLLQSECDRYRMGKTDDTAVMKTLFEGIKAAAVRENGRAYFNVRGAFFDGSENEPPAYEGHYPYVLGPLCEYYEITGDSECFGLMTEIAEGFMYDMPPHCLHRPDGGIDGHNHVQLHAVKGMAQFAHLSRDPRYISWVKAIYDYYHQWALDTGWLPEIRHDPEHNHHSETCLNADVLEIELWLALGGYTNLWDRIDRSIRNYFMPCQFELTEEIERLYRDIHASREVEEVEAGLDFLKNKLEGGFISAVTPNDKLFTVKKEHNHFGSVEYKGEKIVFDMMGCCPPEGMRAIYYAWKYAAQESENGILVNLPYSVDKPFAEVREAADGFTVTAKTGLPLYLRVPAWVQRDKIKLTLNGAEIPVAFGGAGNDYIAVKKVTSGDTVQVSYPVLEFLQQVGVSPEGREPESYTYRWVGNTVFGVEPKAKYLPMFPDI